MIAGSAAIAQVIPDASLGTQSSVVQTNGLLDTVQGGHQVGHNLFHSFRELNVGAGRSLYFADPGVANILTRVTGTNPSLIDGRLGVNGAANLFLLNPNGIIFGAGASLDIRGSFTASTASAIKFADGSEFSATQPTAPNLLTISVPVGLQRGGNVPSASIINRGNLQAGQDLTLEANTLDLQGNLRAERDLTLQATDTVTIRDTVSTPFLASSGRDTTIRGDRGIDILALHHPQQAAIQSQGHLTLVSDGLISGDARFATGGSLQILPIAQPLATFISLYDPILTSAGDVNLALNYTGASLLIEAGGNIQIQGTVDITTPDTAAPFVGDDVVLNTQPGLILRSGQTTRRYAADSGTVSGSTTGAGLVPTPGITLNQGVTIAPDGIVRLTTAGAGDIQTNQIIAPRANITLTSGRSLTTNGQPINTEVTTGNGGRITLTTLNGNLLTGDLSVNVQTSGANAGDGGAIILSSTNGNLTTGNLQAGTRSNGNAGNGGTIALTATNGNLTTRDITNSAFGFSTVGNSGAIALATTNGNLTTGNITTNLTLVNPGTGGNGGSVTVSASNGTITTGRVEALRRSGATPTAQAGTITMTNSNGAIVTGDLSVYTRNFYGISSEGGTITLSSNQGNITTGEVSTASFGERGGRSGGAITITAANGDITTERLFATSGGFTQNATGNGGVIRVDSPQGKITTKVVAASASVLSFNPTQTTGGGGRVVMTAGGTVQTGDVNLFALATMRDPRGFGPLVPPASYDFTLVGNGGSIDLTSTGGSIQTGNLYTFSTAAIEQNFFRAPPQLFDGFNRAFRTTASTGGDIRLNAAQNITTGSISTIGNTGSGTVTVTAGNSFTATGTLVSTDTFGSGRAGDIAMRAPTIALTNGGQLSASAHQVGHGGNIAIAADTLNIQGTTTQPPRSNLLIQTPTGITVLPNVYLGGYVPTGDLANLSPGGAFPSGLFAQTTQGSTGNAGNIRVQTGQLNLSQQGAISTTTFGQGAAGEVAIQATAMQLTNGSIFSGVAPGATGTGGAIAIATPILDLANQGRIQSLTLGTGRAGDITLQTQTTRITDSGSGIISGSGTPEQRGGTVGEGGTVRLTTNTLQIQNDGIISAATFTAGRSGNLEVTADTVELTRQGKLSATTQNQGNAGNIIVTARDRLWIDDALSGIFANTTPQATGNGGSLFLTAGQLLLQNRGRISTGSDGTGASGDMQIVAPQIDLQTQGALTASTGDSGKGGNLTLVGDRLTLESGGTASVSTNGSGNAGNLTVTVRDRVLITDPQSGLFASTTPQAIGNGGSITLATTTLDLWNQGSISAASLGPGRGGDVTVTARQLTLQNQSRIIAETAASDGGNLQLTVTKLVSLRQNSLISASAGTTQAGGNGGNVTMRAGFVVGVLRENSDIRANAFTGNGGRVNITAQGIFGLQLRPQDTPLSDITASSQFGLSGTVTLNTLNIDPNRGLVQLPSNFSDSSRQITQTCSPRQQSNSFVVTGRGGVALNTSETFNQLAGGATDEALATTTIAPPATHPQEATTWQRDTDGSVALVAQTAVHLPAIAPVLCPLAIPLEQP